VSALYTANEGLIGGLLLVLLFAASEAGLRLGRNAESKIDERTKTQISLIAGSVLGVLGLLLGFTLSMAVSRFETRKQLVLEEANAIGTSYLRTQLVPEPDRSYIADRLRDYVDLRLRHARAGDDVRSLRDAEALKTAREQVGHLQKAFWTRAVSWAQKDPNPVKAGLLLQSLNQVIDLDAARWMAFNNYVPETVVYMDVFVALLAATLVGYAIGLACRRHMFSVFMLSIAITVVIAVIIDLDRPRQGLITVTQQPMMDLQQQLTSP
jgi:hypothetical protein